jgi:hypothetical protein
VRILVLALLALPPSAAEVKDAARGFSFTVPEGYEAASAPGALYAYARGTVGEGTFAMLTVSGLGGTIDADSKLNPAIVEAAAKESAAASGVSVSDFRYAKAKWGEHELDEVFSRASGNGLEAVSLTVQVPLKREAVQLVMIGSASDEAQLRAEFQSMLASFKGESSWLTEAERDRKLGEGVGRLVGFSLPMLGIGIWVLVRLVMKRRRTA